MASYRTLTLNDGTLRTETCLHMRCKAITALFWDMNLCCVGYIYHQLGVTRDLSLQKRVFAPISTTKQAATDHVDAIGNAYDLYSGGARFESSWNTCCSDSGFCRFLSSSRKMPVYYINYVTIASFHILSTSLIILLFYAK
jgi:hypothetical protein